MSQRFAVTLGGRTVGSLRAESGRVTFIPADEWAGDASRPVLGQRFEDEPFARFGVQGRVPVWFANLLPEGLLRKLAARSTGLQEQQEMAMLVALGEDLPGAVAVTADDGASPAWATGGVVDVDDGEWSMKFSLAGVQVKLSVLREVDHGFAVPVRGVGGDWIAKLPDNRFSGVPENEFSMLAWAELVGIDVPERDLVPLEQINGVDRGVRAMAGNGRALVVRRFDRADDRRIHIEDYAQVVGCFPEQKYRGVSSTTLLRLTSAITSGRGVEELLRRLVMVVAMDNGDAHLKNWSLIYPEPRVAALSPAYDLVSTGAYLPGDDLALTVNGKRDSRSVERRDFVSMLQKADLSDGLIDVVDQTIEAAHRSWRALRTEVPCADEVRAHVDRQLRTAALFS